MSVNTIKDRDDHHARSNLETTEKEQKTPKGVASSSQVGNAPTTQPETPSLLQSPYKGHPVVPQHSSPQPSQFHQSIPSLSALNESIQKPQSASTAPSSPQKTISDSGLLTLLGPNVSSFPFSELAFIEAMKFKAEQERTKQEFYRAESANKNLNIIQLALQAQIPTNQIPQLLTGVIPQQGVEETKPRGLDLGLPYQPPKHTLPPYPQSARWVNPQFAQPRLLLEQQVQMIQAQQRQIQYNLQQQQQQLQSQLTMHTAIPQFPQKRASSTELELSASPVQPKGFRFGGNLTSNMSQERPQSPAKIGASAVAQLNAPTTPFRVPKSTSSSVGKRSRGHQRHSSMPVLAITGDVSHNARTRHLRQNSQALAKSSPFVQSPSGSATSTLQVKPIPAQPLNEQKRQQTQPLQESMQSFQHVIQFHHWQPEQDFTPSSTKNSPSHKRHKSMTREDLPSVYSATDYNDKSSKDGLTNTQHYATEKLHEKDRALVANVAVDADDADLSVDTSMVEAATKKDELAHPPSRIHSRQELNIGRYPHDILSTNQL